MTGLAEAMQGAVGQPSSVRIGMVDSVDSTTGLPQISLGGTVLDDVGVTNGIVLLAGNPVVLVGQSSQAGSDPASWLAVGAASPYGLRSMEAFVSAVTNLPAALTDLPGTSLTFNTVLPQTLVEMWIYADVEVVLAGVIATAVVRPMVDGALLGASTQAVAENSAVSNGRWSVSARARFVLTPGTHTVKLQGQTAGTANTYAANPATTGYLMHVHG